MLPEIAQLIEHRLANGWTWEFLHRDMHRCGIEMKFGTLYDICRKALRGTGGCNAVNLHKIRGYQKLVAMRTRAQA